MFSEEAHYELLKRYYNPVFFEGRNGTVWGDDYSLKLARMGMKMLGKVRISRSFLPKLTR